MKIKNFKKILITSVVLALPLTLGGCKLFQKDDVANLELTHALPSDTTIAIMVHHTDQSNKDQLKDLLQRFPNLGFVDQLKSAYNREASEGKGWDDTVKPLVEGDWHFVMGINIDSSKSLEQFEAELDQGEHIYFAFQSDQIDFLIEELENQESLTSKEENGVKYWEDGSQSNGFYIANINDILLGAANKESLDISVKNLQEKTGLQIAEGSFANGALVNFYVDFKGYLPLLEEFYGKIDAPTLNSFNAVYGSMLVEEEGFRLKSKSLISENNEMFKNFYEGELSLFENIPGENVIYYSELPSLTAQFNSFFDGYNLFKESLDTSLEAYGNPEEVAELPELNYDETITQIASLFELTKEEFEEVMDTHFAISVSHSNQFLPNFNLYLNAEDNSNIDKFAAGVDKKMKEIHTLLNENFKQTDPSLENLFVLEEMEDGLSRIYLDKTKIPQEILDGMAESQEIIDLENQNLELNYGIKDGIFMVSLQPNISEALSSTLKENKAFSEGLKLIEDQVSGQISYVNMIDLFELIDIYINTIKKVPEMNEAGVGNIIGLYYNKYANFIQTIEYVNSTYTVEGNELLSEGFVRIKEVE